jgi:hypothetical protein
MNTARNCTCPVDLVPAPTPLYIPALIVLIVIGVALVAGLVAICVIACRTRTAKQAPLLASNRDGNSQYT